MAQASASNIITSFFLFLKMFQNLKLIARLLALQLTAGKRALPFSGLPVNNPLSSDFDMILHERVKFFFRKTKAPGLMIGIIRNGQRSYYSYGYADVASARPWESTTVFEIGSITKTFVANTLLQLEAEDKLNANDSITRYLPPHIANNSLLSAITLRDLASHNSGLRRLPANYNRIPGFEFMQPYRDYKSEHLYEYLGGLKKTGKKEYAYSNLGLGLLGTLLQNQTGTDLETLLHQYILQPLQMKASYINKETVQTPKATGYFYGTPVAFWEMDCMAGAGALKSTTDDMLNYVSAHFNPPNERFAKAIGKALQPIKSIAPGMQIAIGWHVFDNLENPVFFHDGGTYGFSTLCGFDPLTHTGLVLVANAFNVSRPLDKLAIDLMILLMHEAKEE
jgi:CubicO group peptidase (beta-lactamase class C family)